MRPSSLARVLLKLPFRLNSSFTQPDADGTSATMRSLPFPVTIGAAALVGVVARAGVVDLAGVADLAERLAGVVVFAGAALDMRSGGKDGEDEMDLGWRDEIWRPGIYTTPT